MMNKKEMTKKNQLEIAKFHLPGLFEFYDFYSVFLPLFYEHREYFYEWVDIASIYGAPADCIWGGGRVGFGGDNADEVLALLNKYGISGRLTFSNSLLREEHLSDRKCNRLCSKFAKSIDEQKNDIQKAPTKMNDTTKMNATTSDIIQNGVIVHSDLLADYLKQNYPNLYLVSSTTKVITDFNKFQEEIKKDEFQFVVPDFRLNKKIDQLNRLSQEEKNKVEFLCNECCYIGCQDRKACYENVSRKSLGEDCTDHICNAPGSEEGYLFSKAMKNPAFISIKDIKEIYLPSGFTNFKIEGRGLGSAILLEFLLYYMVKSDYQLRVRELIYLDSMLNLF